MKSGLFLTLCILTVQSLIAQDTIILKNGKVVVGKIISLSNGIELFTAKDTLKYGAAEVASIIFCCRNKNCPEGDTNSNVRSSPVTKGKTKDNPCNCVQKQHESADKTKPKPKPVKSRNTIY